MSVSEVSSGEKSGALGVRHISDRQSLFHEVVRCATALVRSSNGFTESDVGLRFSYTCQLNISRSDLSAIADQNRCLTDLKINRALVS